ncbi:unnamed protein product, partial [Staurois parvus]
ASSVWAPGCDSLRLHSRVPTEHAREALRFVNGAVVLWDLSRVPKDYGEREDTFHFRSPRPRTRSGSSSLSNSGTRPPKVPILNGEQSLKRNFPFWVELS